MAPKNLLALQLLGQYTFRQATSCQDIIIWGRQQIHYGSGDQNATEGLNCQRAKKKKFPAKFSPAIPKVCPRKKAARSGAEEWRSPSPESGQRGETSRPEEPPTTPGGEPESGVEGGGSVARVQLGEEMDE